MLIDFSYFSCRPTEQDAIYRIEKGVVSATISAEQRRMSQIIGFVGRATFVNGRSISAWTSCISTWVPRHCRAMY